MTIRRATFLILILAANFAAVRWSFSGTAVGAEMIRRPRAVYSSIVMVNLLAYACYRLIAKQESNPRFWTGFLTMGTFTVATCVIFFALARLDHVVTLAQALDQLFLLIPGSRWLLTNSSRLTGGQIMLSTAGAITMSLICAIPQLLLATLAGRIAIKAAKPLSEVTSFHES